jgi:RimJ/RimL family protein N-acetyltransferase
MSDRSPGSDQLPVVVQKLVAFQRSDIAAHLLRLSVSDRRLRFGMCLSDEAVRHYVDRIDFSRDKVFGIFTADLTLIAVAHLALDAADHIAELGLSVDQAYRRRGYGYALLERARLHALNLGCHTLYMHCLSENRSLLRLAAKAGLRIVMAQGEADATLALDEGVADEMSRDRIALTDYRLKQQSHRSQMPVAADRRHSG